MRYSATLLGVTLTGTEGRDTYLVSSLSEAINFEGNVKYVIIKLSFFCSGSLEGNSQRRAA